MECKDSSVVSITSGGKVLIETLWNVKLKDRDGTAFLGLRINRNIMECKAKQRRSRNV